MLQRKGAPQYVHGGVNGDSKQFYSIFKLEEKIFQSQSNNKNPNTI